MTHTRTIDYVKTILQFAGGIAVLAAAVLHGNRLASLDDYTLAAGRGYDGVNHAKLGSQNQVTNTRL